MKKLLVLLLVSVCCTGLFAATTFKNGAKVYVAVKSSNLKASTGLFAKTTGTVSYGDVLVVVKSDAKKSQVRLESNAKVTGWIANGSLTTKKIVKSSSGSTVRASTSELALAGKGFSEEAENAYKASNPKLDFTKVDAIEKITVSENDLQAFATEGHLLGGEN